MIKRVAVRCFQSWKKADLELEPFTVIVGESDQGKSSLIRALESVVQNRAGDDFITYGEKSCSVYMDVDGQTVGWDKPKNTYTLGPVWFEKVGRGVPEQVEQLFDLHEASLAGQFDRPYLLFEPGSQVSEVLGGLTNIALLYEGVRIAKNDAALVANQIKYEEQQLTTVTEQVDVLRVPLELLGALVTQLREWEREYTGVELLRSSVSDLQSQAVALAEKVDLHTDAVVFAGRVIGVLTKALPLVQAKVEQADRIRVLMEQQETLTASIPEGPSPVLPEADMTRYEAVVNARGDICRLLTERGDLKAKVEGAVHNVKQYGKDIKSEVRELEELLKDVAVCPLSGGEFFAECKTRLEQL